MFEKEAEEYVNRIPIFADEGEGFSRTQMQQAFLDGLEAGRNCRCFFKTVQSSAITRRMNGSM